MGILNAFKKKKSEAPKKSGGAMPEETKKKSSVSEKTQHFQPVLGKYATKKPHMSEKSYLLTKNNKYTFLVNEAANKKTIARDVENRFNVKVTAVHTISLRGKNKRFRYVLGNPTKTKKAIVTLKEGQKIDAMTA